jgi:ankyrin repeat protein
MAHFVLMNSVFHVDLSLWKTIVSRTGRTMGIKYNEDQKLLITAAREGQLDVIQRLMSEGFDVDCELKYGSSALMIAASRGHNDIVRVIAGAGGKVNRRNKFGISPLSEAADRGHHTVLRTLVEFGADVNMLHNNGGTAILAAVVKRDIKTVKVLLELGADIDSVNFDGWSARKWALSESDPALLDALGITKAEPSENTATKVEAGAIKEEAGPARVSVSSAGQAFWTVFMRAASAGDLETVRRLVDDGVEINGQSPNGTTALIAAVKNGQSKVACELIELGADLAICDQDGFNAIEWAKKKGLVPFLQVIRERALVEDEAPVVEETCQAAS